MSEVFHQYRFIAVIACLGLAAALATPRGRVPLALRGLKKLLRADAGTRVEDQPSPGVSSARRLLAFSLVVAAFAVAVFL